VVRHEVDAFKKRQADRQFLRALTAAEKSRWAGATSSRKTST
jgi:hypothetical protein